MTLLPIKHRETIAKPWCPLQDLNLYAPKDPRF